MKRRSCASGGALCRAHGEEIVVTQLAHVRRGQRCKRKRLPGSRYELDLQRILRVDLNDCTQITGSKPDLLRDVSQQDDNVQFTEQRWHRVPGQRVSRIRTVRSPSPVAPSPWALAPVNAPEDDDFVL